MRYKNASIDEIPEIIRKSICNKENYIYDDEDTEKVIKFRKGVFMYGDTGTGKTHVLYAFANVKNNKVENWVELMSEIRADITKKKSTIDGILQNDLIFLDDLGSELMSEFNQEVLYLIINKAYTLEKTLFISTNLDINSFTQRYGSRIFDRIRSVCEVVELLGNNKRDNE